MLMFFPPFNLKVSTAHIKSNDPVVTWGVGLFGAAVLGRAKATKRFDLPKVSRNCLPGHVFGESWDLTQGLRAI